MDFVEKRRQEVRERDDRSVKRVDKVRKEFDSRVAELQRQVESQAASARDRASRSVLLMQDSSFSEVTRLKKATIDVPKYYGKQAVEEYLELFEDVVKQNQYEESEWLIRLRVALTGTKYGGSCVGCRDYGEAKRVLVAAHGTTVEKAWNQIMSLRQTADESFYLYVGRVVRAICQWLKLTIRDQDERAEESQVAEALVKQIVLESGSAELRAFMLERKCYRMSMEFQATGMSFQDAHGKKPKKPERQLAFSSSSSSSQPTANCLHVSVSDTEKRLESISVENRTEIMIVVYFSIPEQP